MTTQERFKILSEKYYFDESKFIEKLNFIQNYCIHVEGKLSGQPLMLDDFQIEDIIKPVFGLYDSPGGSRLINQVYIEIPRKNGKTTLMAAVENAHLFNDGENGAQIYNCAGDDKQAHLLFRITKAMINDGRLSKYAKTWKSTIEYKNSFIEKITSRSETKHGFNSHAWIYDELHVAKNSDLYDVLISSMGQRENPIGWMITTAGFDTTTICWNRHEYTEKVNKDIIQDDHFWGVIYAADIDDDPYSPATWAKANPLYNASELLRKDIAKASQAATNDITLENAFKRLRLNIWTKSETKWVKDVDWVKGNKPLPLKFFQEDQTPCFSGLDLASVSDFNAWVLMFPYDGKFYVKPYFFIPEMAVDSRDQRNEFYYASWVKSGYVYRTPGNTTDYEYIRKIMNEEKEKYNIQSIAFDRWNSSQFVIKLQDEDGFNLKECGQGYASLSNPIKEMERGVIDGNLIHDGNPVLRWMCDNIMMKLDAADNIKFDKSKSTDKIDGMVALAMAFFDYMTTKLIGSVYDDDEIKTL